MSKMVSARLSCGRKLRATSRGRIALAVARNLLKQDMMKGEWIPEYLATWIVRAVGDALAREKGR